jgi:hypothetical protein
MDGEDPILKRILSISNEMEINHLGKKVRNYCPYFLKDEDNLVSIFTHFYFFTKWFIFILFEMEMIHFSLVRVKFVIMKFKHRIVNEKRTPRPCLLNTFNPFPNVIYSVRIFCTKKLKSFVLY